MYSFSRRNYYLPIIAGLIKEDIHTGIYKTHHNTRCQIYKHKVTSEQFYTVKTTIDQFMSNQSQYRYNFAGLIPMFFNIPYQREHHYVCSQFVAYVLQETQIAQLEKHFSIVRPQDFPKLNNVELIYSGRLSDYSQQQQMSC